MKLLSQNVLESLIVFAEDLVGTKAFPHVMSAKYTRKTLLLLLATYEDACWAVHC